MFFSYNINNVKIPSYLSIMRAHAYFDEGFGLNIYFQLNLKFAF